MDAVVTYSESTQSNFRRSCWVCFGTDGDEDSNDVVWLHPCKCKGSMKWVHEACLQRWIDEKQKRIHTTLVSCSHCKTNYILTFPHANFVVMLIDRYDKFLFKSSPLIGIGAFLGSIYWCFMSHGTMSIIQVFGYEHGRRIIDDADPLLRLFGLPTIPVMLIMSKMIRWEDFILKLWKEQAYKLPPPLSLIIEQPPVNPRANCEQMLSEPAINDPAVCTRLVCGALLLPTVSALIGKLFFGFLSGSPWRKSLLGGLSFIMIKGALKIYLRKSSYIRYSQRSIKNYRGTDSSDGGGTASTNSNDYDDNYDLSSDNENNDDIEQASDWDNDYENANFLTMSIGYYA